MYHHVSCGDETITNPLTTRDHKPERDMREEEREASKAIKRGEQMRIQKERVNKERKHQRVETGRECVVTGRMSWTGASWHERTR